jgi:hypothetical protein
MSVVPGIACRLGVSGHEGFCLTRGMKDERAACAVFTFGFANGQAMVADS